MKLKWVHRWWVTVLIGRKTAEKKPDPCAKEIVEPACELLQSLCKKGLLYLLDDPERKKRTKRVIHFLLHTHAGNPFCYGRSRIREIKKTEMTKILFFVKVKKSGKKAVECHLAIDLGLRLRKKKKTDQKKGRSINLMDTRYPS